jgi:hypothetical protein
MIPPVLFGGPAIVSDYRFYAAILRFVAGKTDRADPRIAEMMALLEQAARAIETAGAFDVAAADLESTARAFAGVAGFLQKQILPEAVAAGNKPGEDQIRWAIDNAMESVNSLLSRAAVTGEKSDMRITLPPPPA